ncbi:hypothetical protein COO60DRAFT_1699512 [Scenedesmus sp. NREL 46B-D3]|nr:hypothetical protein COO60DRAFT_1699512 [Scenedesmus sp. NREL 46B-D3]
MTALAEAGRLHVLQLGQHIRGTWNLEDWQHAQAWVLSAQAWVLSAQHTVGAVKQLHRSAAGTTIGAARSAAAMAAGVARTAAAATPGVARSAAATAADVAKSAAAAATPSLARSAAAAAATSAHYARSAVTATADIARSAAAAAATSAHYGRSATTAAADVARSAAAVTAAAAVDAMAGVPGPADAVAPSQAPELVYQQASQGKQQQQAVEGDAVDNKNSKPGQQQPKARPWRTVWLTTPLGCFLLGWLFMLARQQPAAPAAAMAAAAARATAGGAAAEGPGGVGNQRLQAAAGGCAHKAVPSTANKQQHQHQRQSTDAGNAWCFIAVDAPAGEQGQQADPAKAAGPALSAAPTSSAAGSEDDEGAAASRTSSRSSNDGLAAAAAAETHRRAPISKAVVQRKQLIRRAGVPHALHLAPKHASAARPGDRAGSAAASSRTKLPQLQQQFAEYQVHSRGSSRGGRTSAGGACRSGSGAGAAELMQLQAVQQPAAALLVQAGRQQQQMQVTFTAGPEVVQGVLVPAVRVLQQLAVGVSRLSVMSDAALHQLHGVSQAGARLAGQLDQLLGWAGQQERRSRLAGQQALGERCGQLGMGLLLAGLGVAAVRVGRLWEVHQVCVARSRPGGWHLRVTGMAGLGSAWQYASCCSQQLGLFAVGLLVLYWLARASWQGLLSSSSSSSSSGKAAAAAPSRAWQLDLLLFRGAVCSLVGVQVVHCLGAAWLPWLLLWLVWVGCQVVVQVVQLRLLSSMLAVVCVGLLLPLAMATVPFHARGLVLQGWVLEVAPWMGQLLVLQRLLSW